jgi:hypothetical protein
VRGDEIAATGAEAAIALGLVLLGAGLLVRRAGSI